MDSAGIMVVNPEINKVILDGSHPLYVIPAVRTVESISTDWGIGLGGYAYSRVAFRSPLTSQLPPTLFIRGGTDTPLWGSWASLLTYAPTGRAGLWTGMEVEVLVGDRRMFDYMPSDISEGFVVVGHGVEREPGEYGILVRNTSGEIVFNSNSNVVRAVGTESRWRYSGRVGGSGRYTEFWDLESTIPADCYRTVVPRQIYRRYNGETATVQMYSYDGRPRRWVIGGRSGSPAFTPMTWIRPMKPPERW